MNEHEPRLFAGDAAIRGVGEAFLACALPKAEWTHEAHLATCAWIILERPDVAPERDLPHLIRRYNESVGGVNDDTQGYHETITQVSIRGVRQVLARCGGSLSERVNRLLQEPEGRRDWPLGFYSGELLFSPAARLGWVDPDLQALPGSPENLAETVHPFRTRHVAAETTTEMGARTMADLSQVKEHMEIVGADGVKVGTVDKVEGNRIKMTKPDSGSHSGHHHYLSGGLVAAVEGNSVRLSANADAAILLEEEKGGEGIADSGGRTKKFAIGAAVVGALAGLGALLFRRRSKRKNRDKD